MRQCTKCTNPRTVTDFPIKRGARGTVCKPCLVGVATDWNRLNRDRYNANHRVSRARRKTQGDQC